MIQSSSLGTHDISIARQSISALSILQRFTALILEVSLSLLEFSLFVAPLPLTPLTMAPLNCCSFRRAVSPEPQPAVLIDTSHTGGRFPLSSHSPSRAGSNENVSNVQPIREIFALATKSNAAHDDVAAASGNDIASADERESGVRRRDSNRRLHDVARKVRKRISRDSGISNRSSKTSLSDDNYRRREELKRALHQRVQEHIEEGSNTSVGSYDEDAVPIKTPKGTWGRHEGSIQISPKHLSNAIRRSDSPSAFAEVDPRSLPQVYAPNSNTAVALSRMLVQRGSSLARDTEEQTLHSKVDDSRRASKIQRYSFSDEDSPTKVPKARSHSPLGRSNTVLHVPSSTRTLGIDVTNPELLDTPGALLSAKDLLLLRPKKVRDSAAGEDSADVHQGASSSNEANETHRYTLGSAMFPGVYDTRIRPASEQLLHGTAGLWGHPVYSKHSNTTSTTDTRTSSSNGHCCNPGSEEMSFGGTDEKDYSPPASENYAELPNRQRGRSEGSDPVHLYDMHIHQRLTSKSLLPSVSLPQLEHPRRDRSYTSGSSSRYFSVVPHRQPSSSISTSWKQFRTPATNLTSSSVYSSGSLPPSPPDSNLHINSLSDRLYYLEVFQPSEEIVSVPASRPMSVDLENLERRTVETSYHSSNESLMNRELAAAETRISPLRANTLPKNSRFREDLDRISAELALTNPPRRTVSNLDGARSLTNENAASVWERALREHSQEDRAISHTRIGSTVSDMVGPRQLDPRTAASNGQVVRKRSSFLRTNDRRVPEPLEGAQLQAHLDAYTLPPRRADTRKRPTLEGTKRSPSAVRASSWARYPSHTRPERSTSPAGVSDQVYSRDFAITPSGPVPKVSSEHEPSPLSNSKKEKTETMTFGKRMLSTISSLYRSQSQELQRRLANEARGHRSSISAGGKLEYPELEMLGSISPPMPSPDIATKVQLEEDFRMAQARASTSTTNTRSGQVSRKQSQDWAREYQDCISIHSKSKSKTTLLTQVSPAVGTSGKDDDARLGGKESVGDGGGRSSSKAAGSRTPREGTEAGLRGSTLDFKRSLEFKEGKARERIERYGVGVGASVR